MTHALAAKLYAMSKTYCNDPVKTALRSAMVNYTNSAEAVYVR